MNSHAYDSLANTYYQAASALVDARERSSSGHASPDTPLFVLPLHIALLNSNGIIVTVNEDWQRLVHGKDTPGLAVGSVGMDYLAVCRQVFGSRGAGEIEASIRAVLNGTRRLFSTEYPHNSPTGRRWFLLQVSQLPSPHPGAVVVHVDITERKLTEFERVGALMREQIKRTELERNRPEPELVPAAATPNAEPAGIVRLRALEALADTTLSQLALDDLMREVLGRLAAAMRVDDAAILLLEEDGRTLTARALQGTEDLVTSQVRVPLGEGFAGRIAATRKPLLVDDLSIFEVVTPLLRERSRSLVGVPLIVEDYLVGVICVGSASARHFTQEDVDMLLLAAVRIAPVVAHARPPVAGREARARAGETLATRTTESEARATERVEALQTILDSMDDGVAVFDRTGHITQTNRAFSEQFALAHLPGFETWSPIVGSQTIPVLDTTDMSVSFEQLPISRALRGEVAKGPDTDIRIHAADGRELDLASNAAPLRDRGGHIVGAVVVTRDISWRKHLERESEEAHDSELALKETAQRLDEFLANAAHDLRSPLTVATTAIDLAISRIERLASAVAIENLHLAQKLGPMRSCLDEARQSVDQLSRMVSVLFDTSQLRAGTLKLHRRTCQLVRVVREQVDALRKANPNRDIRLDVPRNQSVRVVADADRIMQVVTNYITNALKYSPEDQPIDVRVAAEGTVARVSVRDYGPGLSPNEQERIWERFYRVRSIQPSSKRTTGLGLGLHISKTIIELHGGRVGVESAVGAGSTFWFTLPIGPLKA